MNRRMISTPKKRVKKNAGGILQVSLFEIDGGGHLGAVDKKDSEATTSCPEKSGSGGRGGASPRPEEAGIKSIGDLLHSSEKKRILQKAAEQSNFSQSSLDAATKRAIQNYFYMRLAQTWVPTTGTGTLTKQAFGILTNHLKLEDWRYMKSFVEQEHDRGYSFAKTFWSALKPKE